MIGQKIDVLKLDYYTIVLEVIMNMYLIQVNDYLNKLKFGIRPRVKLTFKFLYPKYLMIAY